MSKFNYIVLLIAFYLSNENHANTKSNAIKGLIIGGLGYLGFKGYEKWQEFNRDFTDQEIESNLNLFRNNLLKQIKDKISIMRKARINADKILPKIMYLEQDIIDIEHYLYDMEHKKIKARVASVAYKLGKATLSLSTSLKDIENLIQEQTILKELEAFEALREKNQDFFRIGKI